MTSQVYGSFEQIKIIFPILSSGYSIWQEILSCHSLTYPMTFIELHAG